MGYQNQMVNVTLNIEVNDDGSVLIKDSNHRPITDDTLLRKIKRTEAYKQKVQELMQLNKAATEKKTDEFVNVYKLSRKIIGERYYHNKLKKLKLETYNKLVFNEPKPTEEIIKGKLYVEAKKAIKTFKFWEIKKLREEYVAENFHNYYQNALSEWNNNKATFENKENEKEIQQNSIFANEYELEKSQLESAINGDKDYVEKTLENVLSNIQLPFDFSVKYRVLSRDKIMMDLDLPEIEDLPREKATVLASGKVKIKSKTQKEIYEEYIRSICGLSLFLASHFFNISTAISKICISGYTQKISKKTGKDENEYVYSIIFDRNTLKNINIKNVDPVNAFENFECRINMTKTFTLKEIIPFQEADLK